jgi:hypothetical protein
MLHFRIILFKKMKNLRIWGAFCVIVLAVSCVPARKFEEMNQKAKDCETKKNRAFRKK